MTCGRASGAWRPAFVQGVPVISLMISTCLRGAFAAHGDVNIKLAVFPPRREVPQGHMQGNFVISGQHAEYSLMCEAL